MVLSLMHLLTSFFYCCVIPDRKALPQMQPVTWDYIPDGCYSGEEEELSDYSLGDVNYWEDAEREFEIDFGDRRI